MNKRITGMLATALSLHADSRSGMLCIRDWQSCLMGIACLRPFTPRRQSTSFLTSSSASLPFLSLKLSSSTCTFLTATQLRYGIATMSQIALRTRPNGSSSYQLLSCVCHVSCLPNGSRRWPLDYPYRTAKCVPHAIARLMFSSYKLNNAASNTVV